MKFNFKLGKISCNDADRKFNMDESSISIEMEPSELIECYKLEKEIIPSIINLFKEINTPAPKKEKEVTI